MPQTYDQLFKNLLQEGHFFADFLRLFLPAEAAHLDLARVQPRDKETFTDVLAGEQRTADIVAEAPTRTGQRRVVLVHIEVQKQRQAVFGQRMYDYHAGLWLRYREPVLPIALLLYPEGDGISLASHTMETVGRTYVTFRYWQISLPQLDAQTYLDTASPLAAGLAARMRRQGRGRAGKVALHAACVGRIAQALDAQEINEAQAFLLMNVVGTYLAVTAAERDRLVMTARQKGVSTVATLELTWADRLLAEGKAEGKAEDILVVLRERFGAAPPAVEQRVRATRDATVLERLLIQALRATDPTDLLTGLE